MTKESYSKDWDGRAVLGGHLGLLVTNGVQTVRLHAKLFLKDMY
jgi:hypothetical protein